MNHRFYPLLLVIGFAFAGCMDAQTVPSPEPLSQDLLNLASQLSKMDNCEQRRELFKNWMTQNAKIIENHKKDFDKACQNNNPSDVSCMSLQIFASAGVELELRDCAEDSEIANSLVQLNQLAGTAILK